MIGDYFRKVKPATEIFRGIKDYNLRYFVLNLNLHLLYYWESENNL